MTTRRYSFRVSVALVLVGVVAGCGSGEEPNPPATVSTRPSITEQRQAAPSPELPPTWPLTGVAASEPVARPALGVKIENDREARPQVGLSEADIVWEELVEGGVTRFLAVYHSQVPQQVGPVRSVRPMDPAIFAPMDGILAYSGGQRPFIDAVNTAGIQSLMFDRGDPGFGRVKGRRAPHNVMANPSVLWEQADDQRTSPPPAVFRYAAPGKESTVSGAPARVVAVTMSGASHPTWTWNPQVEAYQRSEGSVASMAADGVHLQTTNVVVLSVEVVDTPFKDMAGTPVPETKLVGSGEGIIASNGRYLPITWSKAAVEAPLKLTGPDGPVQLQPGTTWVELAPLSGGFTVS